MSGSKVRGPLEQWLRTKLPGADRLCVSELTRPGAGASSETHLFDAHWTAASERRSLSAVLRSAPDGPGVFPEYDLVAQFGVLKALHRATSVPVPEVLWLEEDPSVLGVPFFVMRRVSGEAPLDRPSYHGSGFYFEALPEKRRRIWSDLIDAMARLHDLDWTKLGVDFLRGGAPGTDPLGAQLDYWSTYLSGWTKDEPDESYPIFETTLAWLLTHRYEPTQLALCWGDAKLGNVLYRAPERRLAALLDWELAFIGDPELDLASLYFSDLRAHAGQGIPRLEGTPTRDELVCLYEARTGRDVRHFHYNEMHLVRPMPHARETSQCKSPLQC